MVPGGYFMPYVNARPATGELDPTLDAVGFEMLSLPSGPLPAISCTALQAQGSSMQAQLYGNEAAVGAQVLRTENTRKDLTRKDYAQIFVTQLKGRHKLYVLVSLRALFSIIRHLRGAALSE